MHGKHTRDSKTEGATPQDADALEALSELWAAAPPLDRAAIWLEVANAMQAPPRRGARLWRALLGLPLRVPRIAAVAAAAVVLASGAGMAILVLAPRGASASLLEQIDALAMSAQEATADGMLDESEAAGLAAAARDLEVRVVETQVASGLDQASLAHAVATLNSINSTLPSGQSGAAGDAAHSVAAVTASLQGALSASAMAGWQSAVATAELDASTALAMLQSDLDGLVAHTDADPAETADAAVAYVEAFTSHIEELSRSVIAELAALEDPLGDEAGAASAQLHDLDAFLAETQQQAFDAFERLIGELSETAGASPNSTNALEQALDEALAAALARVNEVRAESGGASVRSTAIAVASGATASAGGGTASAGQSATAPGSSASVQSTNTVTASAGGASATAQLVLRAQAGDAAAFEQLRASNATAVNAVVGSVVGDPAATAEIVAAVFARAHAELGQVGDPETFQAWLMAIASQEALRALDGGLGDLGDLDERLREQLAEMDEELAELLDMLP